MSPTTSVHNSLSRLLCCLLAICACDPHADDLERECDELFADTEEYDDVGNGVDEQPLADAQADQPWMSDLDACWREQDDGAIAEAIDDPDTTDPPP